jgi:hypothetical protein
MMSIMSTDEELMSMRESALERKLVDAVKAIGGVAPKWTSPGSAGVPDRIVILPNGLTVYVEMKAPGKQLDPLQVYWFKKLQKLGHKVYKLDSVDDIDWFIEEVQRL